MSVSRTTPTIALGLAMAVLLAGPPAALLGQAGPASGAAPPPGSASGKAGPSKTAASRDRLLPDIPGGLQVWLIPEEAGADFTDANAYLVCDAASGEALLIDAGVRSAPVALSRAAAAGLRVSVLVSTHFHSDHTGGNALVLGRTSARMVAPAKEAGIMTGEGLLASEKKEMLTAPTPRIDVRAKTGDEVKLGQHTAKVIEVSGHSPGGICLHFAAEKLLFSGDTLLAGSIGRTGIPRASKSPADEVAAIRTKLMALPEDTAVLPGHGPTTTIGGERARNPWLKPPEKKEASKGKGSAKGAAR
jgi:glyoxylase-like metal-dependent hydrolase (beta-lactamase superfamily II)